MTIEAPPPRSLTRRSPRFAALDTLKALPARRPAADSSRSSPIQWELDDISRYRVYTAECTVGFIDVVGAVYVVLAGERYDRAVEIAQSLVFESAIGLLLGPDGPDR